MWFAISGSQVLKKEYNLIEIAHSWYMIFSWNSNHITAIRYDNFERLISIDLSFMKLFSKTVLNKKPAVFHRTSPWSSLSRSNIGETMTIL